MRVGEKREIRAVKRLGGLRKGGGWHRERGGEGGGDETVWIKGGNGGQESGWGVDGDLDMGWTMGGGGEFEVNLRPRMSVLKGWRVWWALGVGGLDTELEGGSTD